MLGHKLLQRLGREHPVAGTIRDPEPSAQLSRVAGPAEIIGEVLAEDLASVGRAIEQTRPKVVLNCIGIVKQSEAAKSPIPSITVNALFPHRLATLTAARGSRLIHFSTDCVFSGRRGNYNEDDVPDGEDLYGRTKLLGEVSGHGCLTLRTSIIGRELKGHLSLIDWFLARGDRPTQGFARALYTGLTTGAMAELVTHLISAQPNLEGLWHVAADPISKHELLGIVRRVYGLNTPIVRDETFHCDRRLDGSRFRKRTGWRPPSWDAMINEMHEDDTVYPLLGAVT
jgi:dTDP-4-dehydrorhamnose reductase